MIPEAFLIAALAAQPAFFPYLHMTETEKIVFRYFGMLAHGNPHGIALVQEPYTLDEVWDAIHMLAPGGFLVVPDVPWIMGYLTSWEWEKQTFTWRGQAIWRKPLWMGA